VAYQLELPARLSDMHNVFHISQLKKCLRVPKEQLPLEELDVQEDLTYEEHPIKNWTQQRELPGVREYGCVGFSGVTMHRMRLPGNERTSYR
jgi:hypothetical protein